MTRPINHQHRLSTFRTIRIHRKEVCFVKHILEAYEGVALLSTLDPERGVLRLCIPPGQEAVVTAIMDDLQQHILMEEL